MKHIFYFFFLLFTLSGISSKAQTSFQDSTSILFPNPARNNFFITSQGRIVYALLVSTSGVKRTEFFQNDIVSYQNQFGAGCSSAGCAGANVSSNYICTLNRRNLEDGLYYLVMFDELGQVYFKRLVLN